MGLFRDALIRRDNTYLYKLGTRKQQGPYRSGTKLCVVRETCVQTAQGLRNALVVTFPGETQEFTVGENRVNIIDYTRREQQVARGAEQRVPRIGDLSEFPPLSDEGGFDDANSTTAEVGSDAEFDNSEDAWQCANCPHINYGEKCPICKRPKSTLKNINQIWRCENCSTKNQGFRVRCSNSKCNKKDPNIIPSDMLSRWCTVIPKYLEVVQNTFGLEWIDVGILVEYEHDPSKRYMKLRYGNYIYGFCCYREGNKVYEQHANINPGVMLSSLFDTDIPQGTKYPEWHRDYKHVVDEPPAKSILKTQGHSKKYNNRRVHISPDTVDPSNKKLRKNRRPPSEDSPDSKPEETTK